MVCIAGISAQNTIGENLRPRIANPAGIGLFDGRWILQTGTAQVGLQMVHGSSTS